MLPSTQRLASSPAGSDPPPPVRREPLPSGDERFPALDGVRALAALLIVFFHATVCVEMTGGHAVRAVPAGVVRWFLGGLWLGVDVFFVLSGFLIGRILLRQIQRGRIDFRGFYVRRAFRIFPAYYVVLTSNVLLFVHVAAFRPIHFDAPWTDVLKRSIPNYLYLSNYVHGSRGTDVMGWSWSLCVEEHFYLLLPALLVLLFRASPRVRLAALTTLPLLPVAFRAEAYLNNPTTTLWQGLNWESHTHCDGLFVGVLVAYLFVYHRDRLARFASQWRTLLLAAAFAGYASVFGWGGGSLRAGFFPVVLQLFVLALGTALIIVSSLFNDDLVSRLLAHRFWQPIARVSYGMYLIHPFVAMWLISFLPGSQLAIAVSASRLLAFGAATALVTFLLAVPLYLAVERPLLQRGARAASERGPWRSPG